jgi:hypothetical protein
MELLGVFEAVPPSDLGIAPKHELPNILAVCGPIIAP